MNPDQTDPKGAVYDIANNIKVLKHLSMQMTIVVKYGKFIKQF